MRTTETEVIEVYAETEEVRCDIEGCSTVARPSRAELPDRASDSFTRAIPDLGGWIEVHICASPSSGESNEGTALHQGYLARKGLGLEERHIQRE